MGAGRGLRCDANEWDCRVLRRSCEHESYAARDHLYFGSGRWQFDFCGASRWVLVDVLGGRIVENDQLARWSAELYRRPIAVAAATAAHPRHLFLRPDSRLAATDAGGELVQHHHPRCVQQRCGCSLRRHWRGDREHRCRGADVGVVEGRPRSVDDGHHRRHFHCGDDRLAGVADCLTRAFSARRADSSRRAKSQQQLPLGTRQRLGRHHRARQDQDLPRR
mmetsp:Transcript_50259/g.146046  ORF Transcript_50259/g.146046 Transcript_50259/m.146046 type:complete len:221 (-) Transcript_50259:324-986(-)